MTSEASPQTDEVTIALELEERLTKLGYQVVGVARSGEKAVDMARELRPDLILMDIVFQEERTASMPQRR